MDELNIHEKAETAHKEHAGEENLAFATEQITYDGSGLKGIIKSPFVFGAAVLASFGGFSFGYGTLAQQCPVQCSETH